MNISVFVTIWVTGMSSTELGKHFLGEPLSLLKSNPEVVSVEFYKPEPGDVPVMDDIPAPTFIVQINFESAEQATALAESEIFKRLFTNKEAFASPAEKINLEILKPVHFDLPGYDVPPPRTAPLSFVVRYYGPVKDAGKFANYYMNNHPPILAKFPNIRNVLCYLPLDWGNMGEVKDDRLVIGNEVVFDDLKTFKEALESDILEEAQADNAKFESYGYSSHHAMHREIVYLHRED